MAEMLLGVGIYIFGLSTGILLMLAIASARRDDEDG